jgi:CheY-like chemotaxis protein
MVRQRNAPLAKVQVPKSAVKTAKPNTSLAPEQAEVSQIIQQIRKELKFHRHRAAELEAKLEKLNNTITEETQQVNESKNIIGSLEKGEAEGETSAQASAALPLSEAHPLLNNQKEQLKRDLDGEVGKLLNLKKRLEASLPSEEKKKEPLIQDLAATRTKTILVIDDDPTTVNIITHFLEKEKYSVSSSFSGVDGLKKAFKENPNLILLDILMPDLNGFQFLSILRKDKEYSRIPVIIISSLAEEADVLRGLRIGAADYITKPFSPQVLMSKIKKNLNSGP